MKNDWTIFRNRNSFYFSKFLKYILDFAPELGKGEIVKICGALIRVANDRFPQELKL